MLNKCYDISGGGGFGGGERSYGGGDRGYGGRGNGGGFRRRGPRRDGATSEGNDTAESGGEGGAPQRNGDRRGPRRGGFRRGGGGKTQPMLC